MFDFFQKPFGIDISDHSIEITSLTGSPEKARVLALERVILKPGVIRDGRIIQKEKLTEYLKESIRKPIFGEIKTRNLILSLPESNTFIHSFDILGELDEKEKIRKIEQEAQTTFPFPIAELYYDFIINAKGNILLAAIPREIVREYLTIFKDCQLNPVVFETASESLARALISDNQACLIIDLGARITSFSIVNEKKLILSISLATGGEVFTDLIAEKLGISRLEAEQLKIEIGIDPRKRKGKLFLILEEEMQKIVNKIEEMDRYFEGGTQKKIENIILAGGATLSLGIQEYLADILKKEVSVINPWDKIEFNTKQYFKKSQKLEPIFFSVAIGAALRGLTRDYKRAGINFLKGIK